MTCETCKFSKKYPEPTGDGKLYKEVHRRHPIFFWKILETTTVQRDHEHAAGGETDWVAYSVMREYLTELHNHENRRVCARFPDAVDVSKTYECGEYDAKQKHTSILNEN
jgi:hypothetical protein